MDRQCKEIYRKARNEQPRVRKNEKNSRAVDGDDSSRGGSGGAPTPQGTKRAEEENVYFNQTHVTHWIALVM